jgi:hypothetical protein
MRMNKMIDVLVEDGCAELGDDEEYKDMIAKLEDILQIVADEYISATGAFPKFRSQKEGVAIVEEEFEEFKKAAFWGDEDDVEEEVKQLAAMAVRFMMDVTYGDAPKN